MASTAPGLLADYHELESFDSGDTALDEWLKRRARSNHAGGASRVFVSCEENRVVGYYALSSSAVMAEIVPGRFRRNAESHSGVAAWPLGN